MFLKECALECEKGQPLFSTSNQEGVTSNSSLIRIPSTLVIGRGCSYRSQER